MHQTSVVKVNDFKKVIVVIEMLKYKTMFTEYIPWSVKVLFISSDFPTSKKFSWKKKHFKYVSDIM